MLYDLIHEDNAVGTGREHVSTTDWGLKWVNLTLVCHRFTVFELRIFSQEPWWHAMNDQTSSVSTNHQIFDKLFGWHNFNYVIEAKHLLAF